MINNLIHPPKPKKAMQMNNFSHKVSSIPRQLTSSDALKCAKLFVDGMDELQKEKFKEMLKRNVKCGESIAVAYAVPHDAFINEVRKII